MKRNARVRWSIRFIAVFVRALYATLRVRHDGSDVLRTIEREGRRYILSFWHGQLLLMFYSKHSKPITVLMSQHRDGEISSGVAQTFGVSCVRGSTSRGARSALRALIRAAQTSHLAITPDGPKGPWRVPQRGVIALAQLAQLSVVPCAVVSKKKRSCGRGIDSRSLTPSRRCSSGTVIPSRSRVRSRRKKATGCWTSSPAA